MTPLHECRFSRRALDRASLTIALNTAVSGVVIRSSEMPSREAAEPLANLGLSVLHDGSALGLGREMSLDVHDSARGVMVVPLEACYG
ncbi:MAG: hypothetical protein ACK4IT_00275 [Thioalkalivibrionaceae bacterium]